MQLIPIEKRFNHIPMTVKFKGRRQPLPVMVSDKNGKEIRRATYPDRMGPGWFATDNGHWIIRYEMDQKTDKPIYVVKPGPTNPDPDLDHLKHPHLRAVVREADFGVPIIGQQLTMERALEKGIVSLNKFSQKVKYRTLYI